MTFLDVTGVSLARPWREIAGGGIDFPQPGFHVDGRGVDLEGWALGRDIEVVAVEISGGGAVLQRARMNVVREDIGRIHPDLSGAANSGFRSTVRFAVPLQSLEVSAVLADGRRIPVGSIALTARWSESAAAAENTLVSVIIPCHNQAHYLGEAIESVVAQSWHHFEVIVIDDGSEDNTSAVASGFAGVRVIRQENRGLAEARNTGLRESIGERIVFLDADDRLLPDALSSGLAALSAHPECGFVAGHHRTMSSTGGALATPRLACVESDAYAAFLRGNFVGMHAAVMYRRDVFETVGVFDGRWGACEDWDVYLRASRIFPFTCHHALVAEYRVHGSSMSGDPALMLRASVSVLRRQRVHARRDTSLRDAWRAGIRFCRDTYGEKVARKCVDSGLHGEWREAFRSAAALARFAPGKLPLVLRGGLGFGAGPARPRESVRGPAGGTIIARNYLSHARIVARDFLRLHPNSRFYVLVVDGLPPGIDIGEGAILVFAEELGYPDFLRRAFQYNVVELCTSMKARFLRLLLDRYGETSAFYLDPDLLLFRPLDEAEASLSNGSVVVTPQLLSPLPNDGRTPRDEGILLCGAYNLGFLGVRDSAEARRFLDWWDERLVDLCLERPHEGFFVDQRWFDLAPALFPTLRILRDPTYNVATWNVSQRPLDGEQSGFTVEGRPLALFHFSGFDIESRRFRTDYQTRNAAEPSGFLKTLCDMYSKLHFEQGFEISSRWQYGFGRLENGVPIANALREVYWRLDESRKAVFGDPFQVREGCFYDWAIAPGPDATGLSPFLQALCRIRPDVAEAFPDVGARDREAFLLWARETGSREMGYDPILVRDSASP